MKNLKKETVQRLKNGSYSTLMEVFEEAIDAYNEDKYDLGYGAALSDMSVRAQRLAEYIIKHTTFGGKKPTFTKTAQDDLAKVIETYFTEALKQ